MQTATKPQPVVASGTDPVKSKYRILVVDDDPGSIKILGSALQHHGYQVHIARSGGVGLISAADVLPHLILLDLVMPGIDGFETCERLKMNPRTRSIPVIFLTARNDENAILEGFRRGAVDFITKPYQPKELLMRVQAHTLLGTNQRRLRQAVRQQTRALEAANQRLANFASELVCNEEQMRHELAGGLHDSAVQKLALARIQLDTLRGKMTDEISAKALTQVADLVSSTVDELRSLVFELSPPVLYEMGLSGALEWLTDRAEERWGIPFSYAGDPVLERLPQRVAILLFHSVRELAVNVVRHADAREGHIAAHLEGGRIRLQVRDDGHGFDPIPGERAPNSGGFGLFSIRQRMQLLGGDLHIRSDTNGSAIELILPVPDDDRSNPD